MTSFADMTLDHLLAGVAIITFLGIQGAQSAPSAGSVLIDTSCLVNSSVLCARCSATE